MLLESFGVRLRQLRTIKGLTQAELAERVGVTSQYLGTIERGLSSPSFNVIESICQALETPAANLFLFTNGEDSSANENLKEDLVWDLTSFVPWKVAITFDIQTMTWRNPEPLLSLLGYSSPSPEASWDFFLSHLNEPYQDLFTDEWNKASATGAQANFTFRLTRKDKQLRTILAYLDPVSDTTGRIIKIQGVLFDITELNSIGHNLITNRQNLEDYVAEQNQQLKGTIKDFEKEAADRRAIQALAAQKDRWHQQIFDQTQTGITITSHDGTIVDMNSAALELFGLESLMQAQNNNAAEFWAKPAEREEFVRRLKAHGKVTDFEVTLKTLSGEKFIALGSAVVTETPTGQRVIINSMQDITFRKRVEEELSLKEQAIEASLNAMAMADMNGDMIYVNQAFLRLWGYEQADDVLGRSVFDFWQGSGEADEVKELLQNGQSCDCELVACRRDGNAVPIYLSAGVVRDRHNRPIRMITTAMDISQLKKKENSLFYFQNLFWSFMDNLPGGAFIKDSANRYIFANSSFGTKYDREPEERYGKTDFELYPENMANEFMANDQRVLETGQPIEVIESYLSGNSESHYLVRIRKPI